MPDTPLCRLYLITPPRIDDLAAFGRSLAAALDAGDVASVQLRLKDVEDPVVRAAAEVVLPIVQGRDCAAILNDRPDLAAELGFDGVHVGQQDASYRQARAAVGAGAIVGVTCHDSLHLAMEAAEQGADYVAFGAFFDTATKQAPTRAEPELLTGWQQAMTTPCVAIGGIGVANARQIAAAGADFVAVSAGVWGWPDGPAAAVRALNAELAAGVVARASALPSVPRPST